MQRIFGKRSKQLDFVQVSHTVMVYVISVIKKHVEHYGVCSGSHIK